MEIIGRLYRIPLVTLREKIDALLHHFGMAAYRYRQAGSLSAGQITRVLLIKAFLTDPKIALLDEPTASLDPDIATEVRSFILQQRKERGLSIIITSHNMEEVGQICDRVLVLQKGKILQEDTPEMLARSVAVTVISFRVTEGLPNAIDLLEKNHWHYFSTDGILKVEIEENLIPTLITELVKGEVRFSHLEIQKPSLEDYFLYISRSTSPYSKD